MIKKGVTIGLILFLSIFLVGNVLAEVSHCCEKRASDGMWCVDADVSECDTGFLMEPTACISTSYCALGTCVNRRDGDCMVNVPQRSCDADVGFWSVEEPANIPQCQLGCCAIGDQAAFVTQTKCKSFASLYGIDTHFQSNIQDEISCIASAYPETKGACVFDRELERTCKMTTRSECNGITDAEFHEGFLCTADELVTNCAPIDKTTCVEGKDEVFFLDSCGNVANVYDSSRISEDASGQIVPTDDIYWERITAPDCSDDGEDSNAGDADCGDCNYYDGSTCKIYDSGEDDVKPTFGDRVCRGLHCEFDVDMDGEIADDGSEIFLHGETWCYESDGTDFLDVSGGVLDRTMDTDYNIDNNLPGSRYFRMVCYNGEVTVEPCADRRAEICIQSTKDIEERDETGRTDFNSAACRVNQWQDCSVQDNEEDCENSYERDCNWVGGDLETCVPLSAPGFDFWANDTDADAICALASTTCSAELYIPLEKTENTVGSVVGKVVGAVIPGEKEVEQKGGEECYEIDGTELEYKDAFGTNRNNMCVSLGDCQGKLTGDDSQIIEKTQNYLELLDALT